MTPAGTEWHLFATEKEGDEKWVTNADVYNKLSDVGKIIKDMFPNGELIGNPPLDDIPGFDPNPIYGEFTVYTLGLLPNPSQPIILFSNKAKGSRRWPNISQLYYKIVDLIIPIVLKAERLEMTQTMFFRDRGYKLDECEVYPFNSVSQTQLMTEKLEKSTAMYNSTVSTHFSLSDVYNLRPGYNDPNSKKSDSENRKCMNNGCGNTFQHANQIDNNPCLCHPGYWDFGHTGMTMMQAYKEYERKFATADLEREAYDKALKKLEAEEEEKIKRYPNHKTSVEQYLKMKVEPVGNSKDIRDGDIFWNKVLSMRCVASMEGTT